MSITDVEKFSEVMPAVSVEVHGREISLNLFDGRKISFHADRYKILSKASDSQLKQVSLELDGRALRWEELDEDLTVAGILAGRFQQ